MHGRHAMGELDTCPGHHIEDVYAAVTRARTGLDMVVPRPGMPRHSAEARTERTAPMDLSSLRRFTGFTEVILGA